MLARGPDIKARAHPFFAGVDLLEHRTARVDIASRRALFLLLRINGHKGNRRTLAESGPSAFER